MNSIMLSHQRFEHSNPQFLNPESPCSKCEAYAYNTNQIIRFCWRRPEPTEKIFKITNKFLEILDKVQLVSAASLIALAASLKNAADVLESLRFIGVLTKLFTPKNNRYLLFDPTISFQRKINRLLLLAHTVCKSLRALNKWKLIDLGRIAKYKIGPHLTGFHLITDGLMIASSFFGIGDSSPSFRQNYARLKKCGEKIIKWEERPLSLNAVQSGDQEEVRNFQNRCEAKIKRISHHIKLERQALLDAKLANHHRTIQRIETRIEKLEKKLTKNDNRLQKLNSRDYTAFVRELSEKDILGKLEDVRERKRVSCKNFSMDVMKVASSVSKIFVISLGLLLTTFNITSTIPIIVLLACGIIADSIGLTRFYMEDKETHLVTYKVKK